jgi:hypothetical protein
MHRFPADGVDLADGLGGEFRGGDVDEHIGAGGLRRRDLRIHRRVRRFVALLADDHGLRLGAQRVLDAPEMVFLEIVVLIEDGDLGVRRGLQDEFGEDAALGVKGRLPGHRPRKMLVVAEGRGAGLRHVVLVQVFAHRHDLRRARG